MITEHSKALKRIEAAEAELKEARALLGQASKEEVTHKHHATQETHQETIQSVPRPSGQGRPQIQSRRHLRSGTH